MLVDIVWNLFLFLLKYEFFAYIFRKLSARLLISPCLFNKYFEKMLSNFAYIPTSSAHFTAAGGRATGGGAEPSGGAVGYM